MSTIGLRATPESMAALATATGTLTMRRGSNGAGMMYSGPNVGRRPKKAVVTWSGTSARASSASASAAAIFMASLIVEACTSSAPRKMKGKPSTLLIWLG